MSGKWDQDWQEGGQTLPHYQLCLILYALSLKPTHVPLLKTRKIFASFLSQNQVTCHGYKTILFFFVCVPSTLHISNTGHSTKVCMYQSDDKFICPTADGSANLTCDKDRCPLQGSPTAPFMEPQPTGQLHLEGEERPILANLFRIYVLRGVLLLAKITRWCTKIDKYEFFYLP